MLELFTPIWFRFPILTNTVSIGLVQPPTSMKIRMNYEGNLKKISTESTGKISRFSAGPKFYYL